MYDLPNSSVNTTMGFVRYIDGVTSMNDMHYLGLLLLFVVFIITLISLKEYPMDKAFAVASFAGLLTSAFLTTLQLITPIALMLMIIFTGIALVFVYLNGQEYWS